MVFLAGHPLCRADSSPAEPVTTTTPLPPPQRPPRPCNPLPSRSQPSGLLLKLKVKVLVAQSCLTVTIWTVACQASLSMEFSRQEYRGGLPFPSPEDLPDLEIEPGSPALQADSLLTEPPREAPDTNSQSLSGLPGAGQWDSLCGCTQPSTQHLLGTGY